MSWIAAAIAGSAGLGFLSSYLGSRAQTQAGEAQAGAANNAAQLQYQEFLQQQQNMDPWLAAGRGALSELTNLMGISPAAMAPTYTTTATRSANRVNNLTTPQNMIVGPMASPISGTTSRTTSPVINMTRDANGTFTQDANFGLLTKPFVYDPTQDPSTQWRFEQGQKAVDASAAARGGYFSGATGKALTDYGQNFASTEYQSAYNRWLNDMNTLYNRLAGISGTGQVQSQALGNLGMQTATNMGNFGVQGAQAQAAGTVGAANAWTGGINNLINQGMGGLGTYLNYEQNQALQNWLMSSGGGGTASFPALDTSMNIGGWGAYNVGY